MKYIKLNEVELQSFDLIILGFGPAGVSAATEAAKRGVKVLVMVCDLDITYPLEKWNSSEFAIEFRGLEGQANLWGRQIAFPDSTQLSLLSNALGAGETLERQFATELSTLNKELNLDANKENSYSFEKMLSLQNFKLKYSTYLKAKSIIGFYRKELQRVFMVSNIRVFGIDNIRSGPILVTSQGKVAIGRDSKLLIALGTIASTALIFNTEFAKFNQLGSNLQDHPHGYLFSIDGLGNSNLGKVALLKIRGRKFKRKLEYFEESSNRTAVVEFHLDLNSIKYKSNFFLLKLLQKAMHSVFRFLNSLFLKSLNLAPFPGVTYKVWVQINQVPHLQNRVVCEEEKIKVFWKISDDDKAFVQRIKQKLREDFVRAGIKILEEFEPTNDFTGFSSAFHPSGTIPAHSDSSKGLVSEYGIFHANKNIGLASSAMWPITGWFNPTLAIMAGARLTAKKLLES